MMKAGRLLLLGSALCFFPEMLAADVVADASFSVDDLQIVPSAGTVDILSTFTQHNGGAVSYGDKTHDTIVGLTTAGGTVNAIGPLGGATGTFNTSNGDVSAASTADDPGDNFVFSDAAVYYSGRNFQIVGVTTPVEVEFTAHIAVTLSVSPSVAPVGSSFGAAVSVLRPARMATASICMTGRLSSVSPPLLPVLLP